MRPSKRKLRKWRKSKPMKARSHAEKRGRMFRQDKKEIDKYVGRSFTKDKD